MAGLHPIPPGGVCGYLHGMPLVNVIVTLIVIGVILWLINLIPMQNTIKSIINALVVIVVVLWLLHVFGIITGSGNIHIPVVK
jgi:hypothetical protein